MGIWIIWIIPNMSKYVQVFRLRHGQALLLPVMRTVSRTKSTTSWHAPSRLPSFWSKAHNSFTFNTNPTQIPYIQWITMIWVWIPCWGIQFRFRCISQIRLPSERPRSSLHRRPLGSRPAKLVKTKINIEIRKKKLNTKKIPLRVRWKVFDFKNMPCSPACVVNLHVGLHLPFSHVH